MKKWQIDELQIGDCVIVADPRPNSSDDWEHEFIGTIANIDGCDYYIEDQESNLYVVTAKQIESNIS